MYLEGEQSITRKIMQAENIKQILFTLKIKLANKNIRDWQVETQLANEIDDLR